MRAALEVRITNISRRWSVVLFVGICLVLLVSKESHAIIFGGKGSDPIRDPGWPKGAAEVFNAKSRIAWWEGPPFGGGEWHAEYRGDAAALNEVLRAFAQIDAPRKRLVVHDGVGRSFWLNMNNEESKRAEAEADWIFVVWQPEHWKRLQELPADLRPARGSESDGAKDAEVPVPQIDVYVGGRVRWEDVNIPEGIVVEDLRLEAHGFRIEDRRVLEGTVEDLATDQPIAARLRLEKVESQDTGGYSYETVETVQADDDGHWVLKSAPAGWYRIVLEAEGYVPRIVGYETFDDQPRWSRHDAGLSKAAVVSGRVTDIEGKPLEGADVRLLNVVAEGDGKYETPDGYTSKSDAQGAFRFEAVPVGKASISANKADYVHPGLGLPIKMPSQDIVLEMKKAAELVVTVDFSDVTRPDGYLVQIVPEGGEAIGKWSGSGNVDAAGKITFKQIPPGKYVVTGRPNPGGDAEETSPVTLDLQGGKKETLTITPR